MSQERVYVRGELYLTVEAVAEIYRVEVVWLRDVFASGLLDPGVESQPTLCVAAARLDHVASIVRLRRVLGPDLETIRLALEG